MLLPFVSESEPTPELATLPVLASRLVDQRLDRLVGADKANIDAKAELIEPRKRRDQAFSQANGTILQGS